MLIYKHFNPMNESSDYNLQNVYGKWLSSNYNQQIAYLWKMAAC